MIYLLSFLFATAWAKGETLFDLGPLNPPVKSQPAPEPSKPVVRPQRPRPSQQQPKQAADSNLPNYYQGRDISQVTQHKSAQVLPSNAKQVLEMVNIGDTYEAVINHNIVAFNDEAAPILAVITAGKLKGYRIIGQARLNDSNEGVTIEFKSLARSGQNYTLAATGLTTANQTYFAGNYYSNEAGLFAGTFIASFVAAYFDGLVPKYTNFYGQIQTDTTVDSAFKKGMSGAAIETAQMFKDKLKKSKSFVEIPAPIRLKVLINDLVVEK